MSSVNKTLSLPDELAHLRAENRDLRKRIDDLERLASEREYDRRLQMVLYRLGEVTWSARDMRELYEAIHQVIAEHIYAENLFIAVCSEDNRFVDIPYFVDSVDHTLSAAMAVSSVLTIEEFHKTLTGYVLRTGAPLLATGKQISEMQAQGILKMRGELMESWLGVPFSFQNMALGAIVVQSYDPQYIYTSREQTLLTFVSQQIALAVVRKRQEQALAKGRQTLEEKVEQRTAELRKTNHVLEAEIQEREKAERLQAALYQIAKLSMGDSEPETFFAEIHEIISQLIYAHNFYIALLDERSMMINFPYVVDQWDDACDPRAYDPNNTDSGLTGLVLHSGQSLLCSRQDSEYEELMKRAQGRAAYSWLGVPLKWDKATVGVLAVQSYTSEVSYAQADKELLTFVAQHISAALQRRQDSERLRLAHLELKAINDELEQRIHERTHELSSANRRLQQMLEERKAIEARLAHAASHDGLTGLPNRVMLMDRLQNAINRALRRQGLSYALLFLDLDRFKVVNDSLGHLIGDQLLQHVAERLRHSVRPGDTVARLGGDEFCILLVDIDNDEAPIKVACRVLAALTEPIIVADHKIVANTSIGIARGHRDYHSPDAVLRDADIAMYQAKKKGKAQYAIFTRDMHEHALTRMQLENGLRRAVKQDEIHVVYQPIVDLVSGKVVSVEALARWQHPEVGAVNPEEFIAVAEESGLIQELGMLVLRRAVEAALEWRKLQPDISVSVNLSPVQFNQAGLVEHILNTLQDIQLPARHLRLEITENLFVYHYSDARAILNQLHEAGIGIVMDDFGKGYSSLSYLRNLPLACLKIDRAFTFEITTDHENRSIVAAVNTLAENLGIQVIAEGVETEEHARVLRKLGVDLGQGYYFAKPCDAQAIAEFIQQRNLPVQTEADKADAGKKKSPAKLGRRAKSKTATNQKSST